MNTEDRLKLSAALLFGLPALSWYLAADRAHALPPPLWKSVLELLKHTHQKPLLLAAAVGGLAVAILLVWLLHHFGQAHFAGAPFKRFLRGTRIGSAGALARRTRKRHQRQITVAGIPMPLSVETLHLLIAGSTGSGKSVLIREIVYKAILRGDRMIVVDPNGEMMAKFFRPGDVILNPYDERTQGWKFFNEVRNPEFDFKGFALSIVPREKTAAGEEWASYARLLLTETAKKLAKLRSNPSMAELNHWLTVAKLADLKAFVEGTAAESLFVGTDKTIGSARFVLSNKLPEHVAMPTGNFSLRTWLEEPKSSTLWITWREDQTEALKPLISAWVDILCTSILSLPPDPARRIWMILDELASLEKLASLEAALTKGRKHGLRVVAGLLSVSQLDSVYGKDEAQTLRACFRSLVVLGGSKTDPETCEEMSKALGEHEVEREDISHTRGKNGSTNRKTMHVRERVVMPSQISGMRHLNGYVAFSGCDPIAYVKLKIVQFIERTPAFVERSP